MGHRIGGWWRLWAVVALLWPITALWAGGPVKASYSYSELKEGDLIDGKPTVEFAADVERAISKAKATCPGRKIEISGYDPIGSEHFSPPSYSNIAGVVRKSERAQNLVSCQSDRDILYARVELATRLLSVPLAALVIGLVIQWVYRGFRPKIIPPPAD